MRKYLLRLVSAVLLVPLMVGGAFSANMTWRLQNPSFDETPGMVGWPFGTDSAAIDSYANQWPCGGFPTDGSRFATFATKALAQTGGDYESRTQVVDLTDVTNLVFDAKLYSTSWGNVVAGQVLIDGSICWERTAAGEYTGQRIDVSALTGSHTLELRLTVRTGGTFTSSQWVCWDNVRAEGSVWLPPTARQIEVSGTPPRGQLSGNITSSDQEDWYYFDVPSSAGGLWHLWTQIGPDTVLTRHVPPDGVQADRNDDCDVEGCTLDHDANNLHSRIDTDLAAGERCYLKVMAYDWGAYTIKVMGPESGPPLDANAGPDQTIEQTSGAGAEVTLDGRGSANAETYEWSEGGTVLGAGSTITVTLALGAHTVTLTVTGSGGTDSDEVVVTVHDTTPPTVSPPPDATAEQSSGDGTQVSLDAPTVSDVCDANPVVTNDAPAVFPLGETIVTWTATDASGNKSTATQKVTVKDTTPPAITAPPDVTVEQSNRNGTAVSLGAPIVSDVCDANPVVRNDAPTVFPLGRTVVTWTATDVAGNRAVATQQVLVVDTTPPGMNFVVLHRRLWPPDRRMVLAAVVRDVRDRCDASPRVDIDVTANEPIHGPGHSLRADWRVDRIGRTWFIFLRAKRSAPSSRREYYVTATATDASGNQTVAQATFVVRGPHG